MSEFTFSGVDRTGKPITGSIEAPTEGDLRMILRGRGIRPTKIEKKAGAFENVGTRFGGGALQNVPVQQVVIFTRQLQLLISSGIPLLQALTILHEQASHKGFQSILAVIKDKVAQGSYFWESLLPYTAVFPKLYTAMIRAGESSGSLDQMLKRLSTYLEDSERMKRILKGAMMYPIIVSIIGAAVVALMLIFVIPKFEEMLKSSGGELPELTRMVIGLSNFLVHNILFIIGGIAVAAYLLTNYLKSNEGRAMVHRTFFNAPVFGPIMQKAGVARFCRTLQTLLMSGVNIIDAIDICRATVDNVVLEDAIKKIRAEVEAGKTVGMVVSKFDVFPKMAVQMIMVGEATGNLDKMLEKIADFYDEEVEVAVGAATKLIEPLTLVVLGGTVGTLMIAMYLPIFKLAGGAVGE